MRKMKALSFYPLPIYFGINKKTFLKLEKKNNFDLYFKNKSSKIKSYYLMVYILFYNLQFYNN